MVDIGFWEENRWIWDVNITENLLLHEEVESELESLLSILKGIQLKSWFEDTFVWWRNKLGFSVQSYYQVFDAVVDSGLQVATT